MTAIQDKGKIIEELTHLQGTSNENKLFANETINVRSTGYSITYRF